MQLKQLCHICGKMANITCRLCGRPVCNKHQKNGICDVCRKGRMNENNKTNIDFKLKKSKTMKH